MNLFALIQLPVPLDSFSKPFVGNPVVIAFLVIALPLYRIAENRWGKPSTHIDARRNYFLRVMIVAWTGTVLVLLTAQSPSFVFTVPANAPNFIRNGNWSDVVPIFLLAIGLAVIPLVLWKLNRKRATQFVRQAVAQSSYVRPKNRDETIWMIGVALSLATFQEIVFRGCLLHFFASTSLPFWVAVAVSCGIFSVVGFDFSVRSLAGFTMTLIFAVVMFCLFISVNSLWLPIIVHTLCRTASVLIPLDDSQTVPSKTE